MIRSASVPTRPHTQICPIGFQAAEDFYSRDFACGALSYALAFKPSHQPPVSTPHPHILSSLAPFLPPHLHTFHTRRLQSHCQQAALATLLETFAYLSKSTPTKNTRALAQDDNSEPRRSPIQVLTAQRFPPPKNCFALTFHIQLTTTTSCFATIMCFFPIVFVSFCSA